MKTIPQELRLGNYIKDVGDNGIILQVIALEFGIIDTDKATIFPAGFELDHYIALTAEWFVNFGFTLVHKGIPISEGFRKEIGESGYIKFFQKSPTVWVFEGIGVTTQIQYVHQLQNLYFSLAGKELIIKA